MINTQAIRSKILDLAMRGKISIQNENEAVDFDAEVATDIPYAIPSNWKWVTIESIITKNVGGGTPSKSVDEYWKNGTIPWMSVKDFSSARNGVLEDTIDHITQEGLKNSSSNLVDVNAIIICMRMALGKIVKLKRPMAINQDLRAIWLNSCVDRDYFIFYYSTLRVEGHGMTVAGINKKQLMTYLMPLPPLAEQKRIVEKIEQTFSVLDTIDELQTQYADNLSVLKSKLIDLAIRGKLTEQLPEDGTAEELYQQIQAEKQALIKSGKIKKEKPLPEIAEDEIPFDIPDNWKWVRLSSVIDVRDGTHDTPKYHDQGVPLITSKNLSSGKLDFSDVKFISYEDAAKINERSNVEQGDILFAMIGTIGNPVIVESDEKFCIKNVALFKPYKGTKFDMRFLLFFLQREQDELKKISLGGLQQFVSLKLFRTHSFPLPPLAEQKRIVAKLAQLLPLCERLI